LRQSRRRGLAVPKSSEIQALAGRRFYAKRKGAIQNIREFGSPDIPPRQRLARVGIDDGQGRNRGIITIEIIHLQFETNVIFSGGQLSARASD
jgi:hypothetical protein